MEQTRGTLFSALRTIGLRKTLSISRSLLNTQTISNLSSSRLDLIIPEAFGAIFDAFGDREAIISHGKRYTYSEYKDRLFRFGNGIQDLGIKSGDKVAVMLYNSNEFLEAMFGSSYVGCPNPGVNWHLDGDELAKTINITSPKALLFDEEFLDKVLKIQDKLKSVEKFIVVGKSSPKDMLLYEDLLKSSSNKMPEGNFILALNPYTGGTTGAPKSVNYYDSASYLFSDIAEGPRTDLKEYLRLAIKEFSFIHYFDMHKIKDLRSLVIAPIYHAGALVGLIPFFLGGTMVMMRKFDPEDSLKLIEEERVSWSFVVPTILQRWLALPDEVKNKYYLGTMNTLICAAAPCPVDVKKGTNALFMEQGAKKPVFYEYYGSAETMIITLLRPDDYVAKSKRYASVGKVRCGDLKIISEDGIELGPEESGMIFGRTINTISLRYPGSSDRLKSVLREIGGKEFYDDGLIGHLDEDGFLYLTDRVKDMIISGGVNVYPGEIEEAILRHPSVSDVAVIGVPEPDLGEAVRAEIQLKEGKTATSDEIIEHCKKEGLFGFKVPKQVGFIEELPRHIDGKILKRELRDKYWENVEKRG
ncbi:MAG: AMP-binding protein [Cyanobacteriota bacterium]|nr:AMP-binding protein [Cyanobacteriota bacterium]